MKWEGVLPWMANSAAMLSCATDSPLISLDVAKMPSDSILEQVYEFGVHELVVVWDI